MYATGSDPMSRVHWLTFAEISVAIAAPPLPLAAKMVAMMNSGASDASGASHCTSRKRSMPNLVPAPIRLSANGFAHVTITAAAKTNSAAHRDPARPVGQCAQRRRGADQLGFLDLAAGQLVQVEAEPAQ